MNKIKIYALGNSGNFSYLIVNKNKDFFRWLALLLKDSIDYPGMVDCKEVQTGKGKYKIVKKNLNDYIDSHEIYEDSRSHTRIDVFYGQKKIFIAVHTSLKFRDKFMSFLKKSKFYKK